jgi:predicted DNA binding CopG/RHH family protein
MVGLSLWLYHSLSAQIYQDGMLHKIYLCRYVHYALFTQIDARDTILQKEGDRMTVSKAQQKAVNKYMKENYDRVNLTLPKGYKEEIAQIAATRGQSVNAFIKEAIDEHISRIID